MTYCLVHMPNRKLRNFERQMARNRTYEEGLRLVRDRHLREKMLPTVSAEQEDVCMGFWDSTGVEDGDAINLCPWGKRKVHKAAQQLDHIIRVADGGGDERENLQMLCACCHALKTAAESGSASIGNVVE
jgi:5-methylcytosine-specific restriction endonuclease McrA